MSNIELLVACLAFALLLAIAIITVMACSVPVLIWKCFRLEGRVQEDEKKIDRLDEAVDGLARGIGVPEVKETGL